MGREIDSRPGYKVVAFIIRNKPKKEKK
jgi:hypothetical protein